MFSLLLDHEVDSQYKNEGSNVDVDVSFQKEQENKLDGKPPSSLQDKPIMDAIVKVLQDRKISFQEVIDVQNYIAESQTRILETLEKGHRFNSGIGRAEQFLLPYSGSSLNLVVFCADLVGSTLMTRSLSVDKLATIIQLFTQEASIVVSKFNGQVLKYVGDAVIAYFPIEVKYSLACDSAINCSYSMITILREAINPILNQHGYQELQLKIGIDTSEHSVIQYALGEKSYLDILGYGISMTAKLSSLAMSNQIIISHAIYIGMHPSLRNKFSEFELDPAIWKYTGKEKFQPGVFLSKPEPKDKYYATIKI